MKKVIFVFICSMLFSISKGQLFKKKKDIDLIADYQKEYYHQVFGVDVSDEHYFTVYDKIADWLGVPYQYGGKDESGIDCSGFVSMLFKGMSDKTLGCSASDMYSNLDHIKRNKLKEGDLVFFKIKKNRISHVGLYLGNNKFVHASVSNGVIISDLDEPYYKKYFAKGGRIRL